MAYDIFTSSTSGGKSEYEIMVWLANYNAVRAPLEIVIYALCLS